MIKDKNLKRLALSAVVYEICSYVALFFYASTFKVGADSASLVYGNFLFYCILFVTSFCGFSTEAVLANLSKDHEFAYRKKITKGMLLMSLGVYAMGLHSINIYKPVMEVVCPLLYGYASGVFWLGRHMIENTNLKDQERMAYVPVVGIYQQFFSIIAPLIMSTFVIGVADYGLFLGFFTIATILFTSSIYLMYYFNNTKSFPVVKQAWSNSCIKDYLALLKTTPIARHLMLFWILDAVVYSMIYAAIPMVTLLCGVNAKQLGFVEAFGAVSSLVLLFYLLPKWKASNRGLLYLIGNLGNTLGWLACVIFKSLNAFMLWSFLRQVCNPIVSTSNQTLIQSGVQVLSEKNNFRPQNFILRELVLVFGRVIGISIVLVIGLIFKENPQYAICVSLIIAIPFLGYIGHAVAEKIHTESTN